MKWAGICRLGGIGDNLIASSVLPQLKKQGYMVEVMAQDPYHVVFEHNPYIDKLSVKDINALPKDQLVWQNWFRDRAKEYDKFHNLSHSLEYKLAFFETQTDFDWPASMRRSWCARPYLSLVHDICEVPHEYAPNFFPSDHDFAAALDTKAKLGPRVIGWVIAGSRLDKLYPYAPMVIARLIKELNAPVVLFGAPTEREISSRDAIVDHVARQNGSRDGLHAAMSESRDKDIWPIRRSLSLLQMCDLVITPDTGPAWAVAMRAMPKIVLLGHASPLNVTTGWTNTVTLTPDPERVPCWPCHQLHNRPETCHPNAENNGAACISDISVGKIIDTAAALWAQQETVVDVRRGEGNSLGERVHLHRTGPPRGRAARRNGELAGDAAR